VDVRGLEPLTSSLRMRFPAFKINEIGRKSFGLCDPRCLGVPAQATEGHANRYKNRYRFGSRWEHLCNELCNRVGT
jgi:hypothetical protein